MECRLDWAVKEVVPSINQTRPGWAQGWIGEATVLPAELEELLMDRAQLRSLFSHTLAYTLGVTTVAVAVFIAA